MKPRIVTIPELGMIAGTRTLLGMGAGLLLAGRLNSDQRRAIGWTLLAVGAVSTIPLAAEVLFRHQPPDLLDQATDDIASSRMGVEQS
jgi:hypothetical protein